VKECSINIQETRAHSGILPGMPWYAKANGVMKLISRWLLLTLALPALAQKELPPLKDGTVIDEKSEFRHDGPLQIAGKIKLKGISLDLRGPISVASGAELELDDVNIKVSDPQVAVNGASGLRCEGLAKIKIFHSKMTAVGSAHPIWWLQGDVAVDDFQTTNSEFHLDRVHATFNNFSIFELEISHSSQVVASHLRLIFLSTHTGDNDKLEFSDIPADRSFSEHGIARRRRPDGHDYTVLSAVRTWQQPGDPESHRTGPTGNHSHLPRDFYIAARTGWVSESARDHSRGGDLRLPFQLAVERGKC
jgi:hypothetical protein